MDVEHAGLQGLSEATQESGFKQRKKQKRASIILFHESHSTSHDSKQDGSARMPTHLSQPVKMNSMHESSTNLPL